MRQLLRITATFALALVFTAGMAFGQSPSQLDQADRDAANNFSYIEQVQGDGHTATVEQAGTGNEAILVQSPFLGNLRGPNNDYQITGTIKQTGEGNFTWLAQGGNDTGNPTASVQIQGNNNSVGNGEGGRARQEGNSELNVRMLGNQNELDVGSAGGPGGEQTASVANIDIEGDGNVFDLAQKQAERFNRHLTDADIDGNNNDIQVGQGSVGANFDQQRGNEAQIDVFGNMNTVTVTQNGTGTQVSDNNFSETVINGNGNTATTLQGPENASHALTNLDPVQ
jgi:hypothetical protein